MNMVTFRVHEWHIKEVLLLRGQVVLHGSINCFLR